MDESAHSAAALLWTLEYLVKGPQVKIMVATVIAPADDRDQASGRIKGLLRAIYETSSVGDVQLSLRIMQGTVAQTGGLLCALADEISPEMLVLGSAGKSHMEGHKARGRARLSTNPSNNQMLVNALAILALSAVASAQTVLNFTLAADGHTFVTNVINGPIRASDSGSARVLYDVSRAHLAGCEDSYHSGFNTLTVTAYYKDSNGAVKSLQNSVYNYQGQHQDAFLPAALPAGDLQMWFYCSSQITPSVYDSNYSKNWHVTISQ
ncbi:hypothetical protein HK101_006273 [Irineochytrium annulatum]|nr:hypothetical protein HK101_006273 [Irineochytrium annulatum]